MTLRAYARILRKRWRVVASGVLLGVLIALGVTLTMPVTYAAHATNFVAIGSTNNDATNSLYQSSQFALQRVKSYADVVNSPQVLDPVIAELGLDETLQQLRRRVAADNPPDTVLLQVTVTGTDAAQAQATANAVAQQLGKVIEELETPRGASSSAVKVTTAVPAATPTTPMSPKSKLNLLLGLLSGFAVGILAALLREQLDTSLKSEDPEAMTGRSPLGVISKDAYIAAHPLAALETTGRRVEEFRSIRNNLQFVDVDEPPKLLLVTSAVPNEGKTTFACNLAITLAQSNLNVCLVEADLRRPRGVEYLGLDGSVGLSNVLAGQYSAEEVLTSWHDGLLTVLPAGTNPPDPSRLLGSQTMQALVLQLREQFDVVVFDAPPVLPVTDALVLSQVTDGTIVVMRIGKTRREHVQRALDALAAAGTEVLGSVSTFVRPISRRRQRKDAYGYGYTYDNGQLGEEQSSHSGFGGRHRNTGTAQIDDDGNSAGASPLPGPAEHEIAQGPQPEIPLEAAEQSTDTDSTTSSTSHVTT